MLVLASIGFSAFFPSKIKKHTKEYPNSTQIKKLKKESIYIHIYSCYQFPFLLSLRQAGHVYLLSPLVRKKGSRKKEKKTRD